MSVPDVRLCLPFRDAGEPLRDIADAIGMIEAFTSGMDFDEFRQDPKTIAAVERKLQIAPCLKRCVTGNKSFHMAVQSFRLAHWRQKAPA